MEPDDLSEWSGGGIEDLFTSRVNVKVLICVSDTYKTGTEINEQLDEKETTVRGSIGRLSDNGWLDARRGTDYPSKHEYMTSDKFREELDRFAQAIGPKPVSIDNVNK